MSYARYVFRFLLETALVALLYVGATKVGFALAFFNTQVSPVWPPEGVALAALLLRGQRMFVGVFLGAVIGNYLNLPDINLCVVIGFGNSLGAVLNAFLVFRIIGGRGVIKDRAGKVIAYVFLCIPLGAVVSASIGVGALDAGGYVPVGTYWLTWATWWAGELQGYLIIAPLLFIWSRLPRIDWSAPRVLEGVAILIGVIATGLIVFTSTYPLTYLPIPFLVWAAFRFQEHGATLATAILSAIAVIQTTHGFGPFVVREGERLMVNEALVQLQVYLFVIAMMTLFLAATVFDRETARRWIVTQRNAFYRFVPIEFLKMLGKERVIDIELGDSTTTEMSVLFTDIRSFTNLSDAMSAEETFRFLNSLFAVLETEIEKCGGFVDKFLGDAVMALFADNPEGGRTSADNAVEAGLMMQACVKQFNEGRRANGESEVQIGIGINTGTCMIGTVGSERRLDTTVVGNTVNIASRLEGLTKRYATGIVVSQATLEAMQNPIKHDFEEIGPVLVRGKAEPVVIYKVKTRAV